MLFKLVHYLAGVVVELDSAAVLHLEECAPRKQVAQLGTAERAAPRPPQPLQLALPVEDVLLVAVQLDHIVVAGKIIEADGALDGAEVPVGLHELVILALQDAEAMFVRLSQSFLHFALLVSRQLFHVDRIIFEGLAR